MVVACIGLALPSAIPAQAQESVDVVIGERYAAGGVQRAILGNHYRDAWTTEVSLPVLNLTQYAGGLTAERKGGGQQTISLVFRGEDRRRYSFRLIDKDPTPALPPELRGTAANALLQDQISASHPLAILVVNELEMAAGVNTSVSEPFVMPDDPALGEFREEFAGQAGILAERPGDEVDGGPIFGGYDNIDGSDRIRRRMRESQTERVDARAFLNARLFDLLIGDWDRHPGQWTWARPVDSENWLPIAEDRDQAFSRLDGLLPSQGHRYVRHLVGFGEEFPDIYGLHHQARDLDRQFLAELSREDWHAVAAELQAKMTNNVIDDAVRRLPDAMYEEDGAFISNALKARRDALQVAADDLYTLLAVDVEVHLTDLADQVEVTSLEDSKVEVRVWPSNDPESVFFERVFDPSETKEIRIYLDGDDDIVTVGGRGELGLLVRVVGGEGDDVVHYDQNVGRIRYYDAQGENQVTGAAPSHAINAREYEPKEEAEDDDEGEEETSHDVAPNHTGSWTVPSGSVGFSSEFGFVISAGATRFDYGFRRDPYKSRLMYGASASSQARFAGHIEYGRYLENSTKHVSLGVRGSQFGLSNFYGFGNDSPEFAMPEMAHVLFSMIEADTRFGADVGDHGDAGVGVEGRYTHSDSDMNPFLPMSAPPLLYGAGGFSSIGAFAEVNLDSRNYAGAPTRGLTIHLRGTVSPEVLDVMQTYGSLEAVGTAYISAAGAPFEPTLALRAGARGIFGDAPFFDAAFLGGSSTVRGFDNQRFAGDVAVFGTAEVRLFLFKLGFLTKGDVGVIGFSDVGRVYLDGDSPGGWHQSFGGGVWLGLLGRTAGLSAIIAQSDEGSRLHIGVGMPF